MSFGKDYCFEEGMSDAVEGGAALAWRLLATLEGGSLLLATSALLAYTVRNKIARRYQQPHREIRSVLITNTTNLLGRELKKLLEAHGCVVSEAISGATSGDQTKVDALIVVGAEPKEVGLHGVAELVSEDVYDNLKILESLSVHVRRGGCLAWACTYTNGSTEHSFSGTSAAFDTVLHASLQHVAKVCDCEPVWVGRCETAEQTAERITAALMPCVSTHLTSRFSLRYAAHTAGVYLCRWLKIVS